MIKKFSENEFVALVIIANTPLKAFKGKYDSFKEVISKDELIEGLEGLEKKKIIHHYIDDDGFFIAGLLHGAEIEYADEIKALEKIGGIVKIMKEWDEEYYDEGIR